MPEISVVMPVYNTEGEYLKEAIESILKQTFGDFEFIICDDGSTNADTLQVLNEYSNKDSRIRIIKGEHRGISAVSNKLLDAAEGKYIARMDSDDISMPERFEKQLKYFETHPELSLVASAAEIIPFGGIIEHHEKLNYLNILKGCYIHHSSVMLKKADFDKYGLRFDENYKVSEDYELWSRAIRYLNMGNIREPLIKYRVRPDSNFHKDFERVLKADTQIRQNMLEFLTDDKEKQQKIMQIAAPPLTKPDETAFSFVQRLFFTKNEYRDKDKIKYLSIFGKKFILSAPKYIKKLKRIRNEYPKVMTTTETLDEIVKGKSIARFGDGEISIIIGLNLAGETKESEYQLYDKKLADKLRYILKNPTKNCIIGIDAFCDKENDTKNFNGNLSFWENFWLTFWRQKNIKKLYKPNYKYANTAVTRITVFKQNTLEDIKQIWDNKKVLFVVGNNSHFFFDNILFNNIKSADMLVVKGQSSFSQYDEIIKSIRTYDKDTQILLSLGPCATVLAYELSKEGYQAIDIGHLPNCRLQYEGIRKAPEIERDDLSKNFYKKEGVYKIF